MEPDTQPLGVHDVDLADWRWLLGALRADFAAPSLAAAGALVAAVTTEVDEQLTSAEISVAGGRVLVTLRHGDPPVVTHAEVRLAQRISALAAEHGLTPEPGHIQALELGLDTPLDAAVRPFWAAVLGVTDNGADVIDPTGALPALWFQATESTAPDRQRFHLDISVPPEVAQARVDAGVRAGGTVVDRGEEPAFTVLADADGNKICVCTALGRD